MEQQENNEAVKPVESAAMKAVVAAAICSAPVCANCYWHTLSVVGLPMCIRKIKVWRDVVTGKSDYSGHVQCFDERARRRFWKKDHCGPEGQFFKPNSLLSLCRR